MAGQPNNASAFIIIMTTCPSKPDPQGTDCEQRLATIRPALTFSTSHFKPAYEADAEPVTLATDAFYAVNNFLFTTAGFTG